MKLICLLIPMFLFVLPHKVKSQNKPPGDLRWRIDEGTFMRMKGRGCFPITKPCHGEGNIVDYNSPVIDSLKKLRNFISITPVGVRYTADDEERYMYTRGIPLNEKKKWRVRGYKTEVYIVKLKLGKGPITTREEETLYFDVVRICPPPDPPCNKSTVQ